MNMGPIPLIRAEANTILCVEELQQSYQERTSSLVAPNFLAGFG